MAARYDVFLSHSSADKLAVEELARKLLAAGLTPFLDKWYLIPGKPWAEALEEALDQSRTCTVFLGPGGVGAWQNEEMRSALETRVREKAFRVIPILLPGSFEPRKEELPRFLRRLAWVDFRGGLDDEDAFRRLVSGIRGQAPGPGGGGRGSEKPSLPSQYRCMAQAPLGFVHRSQYEEVLDLLCSREGENLPNSVGFTTALCGAGGFGKTTLAQAICFDEKVRQTYPDGILWTTMGEEVDSNGRLSRILDLIRWWTDEEPPGFKNLHAASSKLREILSGCRVLVVMDDAWSPSDVVSLQGLANGSALLITTRDSQVLPADSKFIRVDAMASFEAVELLWPKLPIEYFDKFQSLAIRLGEWPLLLKLVSGQLRKLVNEGKFTIPEALQEIESALNSEGFSAFDQNNLDSRHAAASRTIFASFHRLPEKRDLYLQLAIFPDEDIPLLVLSRYWGLTRSSAHRICGQLHDLSLLLQFDRKAETIRLHSVIRKILIEQVKLELPALHARLLDSFRPNTGQWKDLPVDEKYLWRNLAGHLQGADHQGELRQLLTEFSFLAAKLRAMEINSLIADYEPLLEEIGLHLIRDALRLSAHVLTKDQYQLAPQLLGRLQGRIEHDVQQLVGRAKSWRDRLWLRPRTASLTQPGGGLIQFLEGHTDWVKSVAVVGRRAVSASIDRTLRVWDLNTGQTLRTLEGHTSWVNAVAVVDGQRAVSASVDGTLRVWDLESGETLRTLKGHTDGVNAVAVVDRRWAISASGDGTLRIWDSENVDRRWAISASDDGTLRVWDLESGETLSILKGGMAGAKAVAVVDGRYAVSASADRLLRVWNLETGQTVRILEGHTDGIKAVTMVDPWQAVSASDDQTLGVWDLEIGQYLRTLTGHTAGVRAVAKVDGQRVISASADEMLRVWDLESNKTLRTLEGHTAGVNAVAMVDGRHAVSASADKMLGVWDLESDQIPNPLQRHTAAIRAMAMVDGRRTVSGSLDGTLRMWDLETSRTLCILKGHQAGVRAVAVDGRHAISASMDLTLRLWDLESGQTLRILEGHTNWINAVAIVDGRRAVSASYDNTLRVWDMETGQTLRTLKGHTSGVEAVAVVDGGRYAVSYSNDGTMRKWDLETSEVLWVLEGFANGVNALALIDRKRAVSAYSDGILLVWDLETGQTLRTLEGCTAGFSALAVVDSHRVVSGSNDRTLRVWNLETGTVLAMLTLDAPVTAVALTPNGRTVVAGDASGRVHFLDLVLPE